MHIWIFDIICMWLYTGHVGREMQSSSDRLYVYNVQLLCCSLCCWYILHGFELIISFLFSHFTKPSAEIYWALSLDVFSHTSYHSLLCVHVHVIARFWILYFKQWLDRVIAFDREKRSQIFTSLFKYYNFTVVAFVIRHHCQTFF